MSPIETDIRPELSCLKPSLVSHFGLVLHTPGEIQGVSYFPPSWDKTAQPQSKEGSRGLFLFLFSKFWFKGCIHHRGDRTVVGI